MRLVSNIDPVASNTSIERSERVDLAARRAVMIGGDAPDIAKRRLAVRMSVLNGGELIAAHRLGARQIAPGPIPNRSTKLLRRGHTRVPKAK